MALTAAEKQKRYRERQKQKSPTGTPSKPVALVSNLSDEGFKAYVESTAEHLESYDWFREQLAAVQFQLKLPGDHVPDDIRTIEKVIQELEDALVYLTGVAADFRKHQVNTQIERIKKTELGQPELQDQALARIVELTEIQKRLHKKYRIDLYDYFIPRR